MLFLGNRKIFINKNEKMKIDSTIVVKKCSIGIWHCIFSQYSLALYMEYFKNIFIKSIK